MRHIVRLTENNMHRVINEAVKRTLNEYINSMTHSSHNLNDYLDDDDFLAIVHEVVGMYGPEDFDANDQEYIDSIAYEIADVINDFVSNEALDDFGYKYGQTSYNNVAYDVIEYIQEHLDELY